MMIFILTISSALGIDSTDGIVRIDSIAGMLIILMPSILGIDGIVEIVGTMDGTLGEEIVGIMDGTTAGIVASAAEVSIVSVVEVHITVLQLGELVIRIIPSTLSLTTTEAIIITTEVRTLAQEDLVA